MKPFTQTADTLDQSWRTKSTHSRRPWRRSHPAGGHPAGRGGRGGAALHPGAAAYYVAERLGVKPTQVYDVISFYTALHDKPRRQVYPGGVLLRPLPGEGQRHPAGAAQAPFKSGGGPGDL